MDLNKELELKVKIVKDAIKNAGGTITQEEMAKKLGRSRTYFSQLKKGHENVSPQFMAFFNETFKQFLPKEDQITKADIAVLQSSIDVIIRELAKIKKDFYKEKKADGKEKTATDYLKELLDEVSLSEVGMKIQKNS